MNVQLKNYKNLPLVVLLIIGFSWSLARPVVGEDLGTFLTGFLITLLLFGSAGLKNLFKKMHAPIWFPFFVFVMMKGSYVKKLDKNKCIKYFELRPLNTF